MNKKLLHKKMYFDYFVFTLFFMFFIFFNAIELVNAKNTNSNIDNDIPEKIVFATGNEQGLYNSFGKKISLAMHYNGIDVKVLPTAGSIQNISLLANDKVQICIAQADIFKNSNSAENIQVLVPLYTETIHILIRNPIKIRHLSDLKGKRISLGPVGGGTEPIAIALLEAAGVSKSEVLISHLNYDETVFAMKNKLIDASFIFIGDPAPIVESLMKSHVASMYEPDTDIVEKLLNLNNGYVLSSIKAGTYSYQEGTVNTIGVPALLLVSTKMNAVLAERIVKIIMEKREDMAKETGIQLDNYSVLTQIKRINVVLHIGAKKYYDKQLNSTIKKIESFTKLFIVPCFVIFLLIGIYKNWFKIARLYRQYPVIRVLLILFGLLFCGTTVMFNAEHRINDNYATWGLSFWSTLMNWINFGSKEPVTVAGRINSTIMTILGLGGISWITSEVLHMIITRRTNPGGKRMKDHFIIINWNEKGNMLVNNIKLMQSEIGSHAEIVVVSQTAENRKNDYEIVQDDPLAEDIVDRTNMKNARSVIVMSKENIPSAEADTQNILIILNLAKQLKGISKDKQPHIVLEISSPDKVHLLSEGDLDVEVVSTKTIAGDLLVQVAANPGLTEVYMDLLTNAKGSSEIYSIKLSSNWYGLSFEDIFNTCAKMRAQNTDILPLAIKRGLKTIVNPTKNDIGKIEEGDILFAICDNLQLLYKLNTIKYKI